MAVIYYILLIGDAKKMVGIKAANSLADLLDADEEELNGYVRQYTFATIDDSYIIELCDYKKLL